MYNIVANFKVATKKSCFLSNPTFSVLEVYPLRTSHVVLQACITPKFFCMLCSCQIVQGVFLHKNPNLGLPSGTGRRQYPHCLVVSCSINVSHKNWFLAKPHFMF